MFYNSPDNIVEFNLQTGQTPFATWVNSNTIRINNVLNGLHRLRAHLATSTHTNSPNPEADTEIEFLVSSTNNIYGLIGNNNSGIDEDAILGDPNAPVTMIMFGGYEETFSRKFYNETFSQIKLQYIDRGKVKFVFRDFPLVVIFPLDQFAAEIAECVGEYGNESYYKMFNELFEKGLENADDLGYDIEDCAFSGQMAQEVIQDYLDAQEMGVVGSPTFFINGEMISGVQPFENFQAVIEEKLNESIICFSDIECGVDGFIESSYCSLNNVVQNFQNFTCINPETLQSSCQIEVIPIVSEICSDACSNGICVEIACSSDSDCDDSDPYTKDTCLNPGQISSQCVYEEILTINSPSQNLFDDRRVQFNITLTQPVNKITFIDLEDLGPREKTLCNRNCNGYGHDRIRTRSFNEGFHNVSFRAYFNDTFIEERREFIIDSKNPRISRTEPRRGFASGIFNVEFTEDNPIQLTLFYGNNSIKNHSVDLENECVLDRTRYKCETKVNLSEFDGNEIPYWFNLTDVIGNTDKSKENKVDVDTTKPVLNYFNYSIDRRRVEFIFNVTEKNFDEINYIDWNDSRQRKTRICSRLRDEICEVRRSFGVGEHNLTINILDEAGNFIETTAQFIII